MKLICEFRLTATRGNQIHCTVIPNIADIQHGFWVTRDMKFTKASDCAFWIPPSAVLYVEKDEV